MAPILRGEGTGSESNESKLDIRRCERSIWLVKVPTFVKDAWSASVALERQRPTSGGGGPVIGTVILAFDPTAETGTLPDATLHLSLPESSNIPKEYNMTFQPDSAAMAVFSKDVYAGDAMAAEGKVEYKLDLKPTSMLDESYNELSKTRMMSATKKTRTVQMLSEKKAKGAFMRPLPVSQIGGSAGKGGKNLEDRRSRWEKEVLQDMIFKLFERQTYWTFRQLQAETKQPVTWLKEVLQEVCRFNKRGPNADKWEVKGEYKHVHASAEEDEKNPKIPKLE
mmetsp:Transcript_9534/g.12944  ORF Transcript_9534/g.12944 Transcript_9534/m.12944 type:complete len:281 (-) Transcript_9534:264-1106(-)|eukprot:CAMPEP_0196585690 /NCGR_PEP_ID=MMETSP1081-20130531/51608_1 /TAXON_ID=36882 /ORGANISM="Pyramimonas amylifera, Strain CCMP720" /LENGTH=280 /DNA_ID=CAMNT_0041907311 /DNA_START=136 /DNA_END=978 /DNA_ORIENTATION=-